MQTALWILSTDLQRRAHIKHLHHSVSSMTCRNSWQCPRFVDWDDAESVVSHWETKWGDIVVSSAESEAGKELHTPLLG